MDFSQALLDLDEGGKEIDINNYLHLEKLGD